MSLKLSATNCYLPFVPYFAPNLGTEFRRLAMILLVLSFAYPLLIEDIPLKMFLALNVLHIIVASVTVVSLTIVAAPPEH